MKSFLIFTILFVVTVNSYCENIELAPLLEQIDRTTNIDEKNKLLDELKKKLAQKNKKAREEADAIIEAKKKIPLKVYDESLYNEKEDLK